MDIPILGAILTGIFGSIVTALLYRSLTEAKVKSIVAETYDKLIATLTKQVEVLQDEGRKLQGEVDNLRIRLDHHTKKELEYLTTITELTKERNFLQNEIARKEELILKLQNVK